MCPLRQHRKRIQRQARLVHLFLPRPLGFLRLLDDAVRALNHFKGDMGLELWTTKTRFPHWADVISNKLDTIAINAGLYDAMALSILPERPEIP
jgi:hypothetical protein